jgi:hypothetical protein
VPSVDVIFEEDNRSTSFKKRFKKCNMWN